MTIEELLGYSADDLEKMSDAEVIKILQPYIERCKERMSSKETVRKIDLSESSVKVPNKERKLSGKALLAQQLKEFQASLDNAHNT